MRFSRREFVKLGITAVAGLSGAVMPDLLRKEKATASETAVNGKALRAKRWAMVVDESKLKTPENCQKIIKACHEAHNVPDISDSQHEIKWIWNDTYEHAFGGEENPYLAEDIKEKQFPLLCNHCDNPACVRVCPTQATFKRPDGIVSMDYHRCIGCRFCMAACPFGARSFNFEDPRPFIKKLNPDFPTRTKGVVEKCTFCVERLEQGLQPACVEASNGALVFGDLDDPNSEVRKLLAKNYSIRRKPQLGTEPSVYYLIGGGEERA